MPETHNLLEKVVHAASEVMTHYKEWGPRILEVQGIKVTIETLTCVILEYGGDSVWDKMKVDGVVCSDRYAARSAVLRKFSVLFEVREG